ncbi:putative phosphoinositide phospholipase C [Helianthus debilis subsp. tardiflorus]
MLHCPKAGDNDEFPSTKPPKECLESNKLEEELIAEDETPCICENTNPSDETFLRIDSEDEDGDAANEKPGQKTPREYIQIIGIHAAKANKELRQALEVGSGKGKRISMSEQTLEKAAEDYGSGLLRFTQKNFVRVFPKGTRVTSSNFKPLLAWMHGAQIVASNIQGYGKSLWMMHGMFRSNGGCGYVKKPDFLMRYGPNNEVFNPKVTLPVKKTLKVTVYMGDGWHMDFSQTHFDTFSPPDFYTKLALLKIVVQEHDVSEKDDFVGQTCLPVSELRSWIRSIPLHNKKGEKFESVKLLKRFVFE